MTDHLYIGFNGGIEVSKKEYEKAIKMQKHMTTDYKEAAIYDILKHGKFVSFMILKVKHTRRI